jgi:hypothetical protein
VDNFFEAWLEALMAANDPPYVYWHRGEAGGM